MLPVATVPSTDARQGASTVEPAMRIALLAIDPASAGGIVRWLEAAGHQCTTLARGDSLLRALRRHAHDLVLLDWAVPDPGSARILRWMLHRLDAPPPVILMATRSDEADVAAMLHVGADDYLLKPLRQHELLARIAAVSRRSRSSRPPSDSAFSVGPFGIDPSHRRINHEDRAIALTRREFDLACHLFRHCGEVVSRADLLVKVWGRAADLDTRTVDTHASRLRIKLGLDGSSGWRLAPVYQLGYRLEPTGTGASATASAGTNGLSAQKRDTPPSP
jgi:DNA-binding response OmpR family regulator